MKKNTITKKDLDVYREYVSIKSGRFLNRKKHKKLYVNILKLATIISILSFLSIAVGPAVMGVFLSIVSSMTGLVLLVPMFYFLDKFDEYVLRDFSKMYPDFDTELTVTDAKKIISDSEKRFSIQNENECYGLEDINVDISSRNEISNEDRISYLKKEREFYESFKTADDVTNFRKIKERKWLL